MATNSKDPVGFSFVRITDRGDVETERLVLKAQRDIPKGSKYLIFDNTFNENGNPVNRHRHMYYLRIEEDVPSGELVVIWTKSAENDILPAAEGKLRTHRYFWGLKKSVWNKDTDEVAHVVPFTDIISQTFKAVRSGK
ncbi:MAG: hypothetical protein Unbinned1312contig1001_7 [Prokaryotic dsDNA virus sp.]|nr:MAG: hypothetical protein Unbinned1312contig1001_7 [Prokaryotic dsDNA virus sp.]|tara:strand:+ start:250 stop:663 length:414 start_codon:yes stop_codon:yes gene_type:complete